MTYLKAHIIALLLLVLLPVMVQAQALFRFEHYRHLGTRVVEEDSLSISSEVCAETTNEDALHLIPRFYSTDNSFNFDSSNPQGGIITIEPGDCQEFSYRFTGTSIGKPVAKIELECHYQSRRCDQTYSVEVDVVSRETYNDRLTSNGLIHIGDISLENENNNILFFSDNGRKLLVGNSGRLQVFDIGESDNGIIFGEVLKFDPPLTGGQVCDAGGEHFQITSETNIQIKNRADKLLVGTTISLTDSDFLPVLERDGLRMVQGQCPGIASTSTQLSGRLEVFDGQWGSICEHDLDPNTYSDSEAGVACRQLGLATSVVAALPSCPGNDAILRDHVDCSASDERFQDCLDATRISGFCNHDYDIGVSCSFSLSEFVAGCSAPDSEVLHLLSKTGLYLTLNKQAFLNGHEVLTAYLPPVSDFTPTRTLSLNAETIVNTNANGVELIKVGAGKIDSVATDFLDVVHANFTLAGKPGSTRGYAGATNTQLIRYEFANRQIVKTEVNHTNTTQGALIALAVSKDGMVASLYDNGRTFSIFREPGVSSATQVVLSPILWLLTTAYGLRL